MRNYVHAYVAGRKVFFHFLFDPDNKSTEYLRQHKAWCEGDVEELRPLFDDARDQVIMNLCDCIEEQADTISALKKGIHSHA